MPQGWRFYFVDPNDPPLRPLEPEARRPRWTFTLVAEARASGTGSASVTVPDPVDVQYSGAEGVGASVETRVSTTIANAPNTTATLANVTRNRALESFNVFGSLWTTSTERTGTGGIAPGETAKVTSSKADSSVTITVTSSFRIGGFGRILP